MRHITWLQVCFQLVQNKVTQRINEVSYTKSDAVDLKEKPKKIALGP